MTEFHAIFSETADKITFQNLNPININVDRPWWPSGLRNGVVALKCLGPRFESHLRCNF